MGKGKNLHFSVAIVPCDIHMQLTSVRLNLINQVFVTFAKGHFVGYIKVLSVRKTRSGCISN